MPKDLFSTQANLYAQFRPTYPQELYNYLLNLVPEKQYAWDCATGNGQVASYLSDFFEVVYATDISQAQLNQATKKDNIQYSITQAEKTSFPDNYFNLITVAQAMHWLDFDLFYVEVERVARHKAIFAAWGYGLLNVSEQIDEHLRYFYYAVIGPYWEPERKFIDERYQTIPFPFQEQQTPSFKIKKLWTLKELEGYLSTWSAVQKFIKNRKTDPVKEFIREIKPYWSNEGEKKQIEFPLFLRVGSILKV